MKAASVADFEVGKWERAEIAVAAKAKYVSKIGPSRVGGAALIVGDSNFFPGFNVADRMDCLAPFIAVPTIMSIWETAVVEAGGRAESTHQSQSQGRKAEHLS